jgi:hypothetical protein
MYESAPAFAWNPAGKIDPPWLRVFVEIVRHAESESSTLMLAGCSSMKTQSIEGEGRVRSDSLA